MFQFQFNIQTLTEDISKLLFFSALAPGTLRPVDPLLSAMLTCTVDLTKLRDVQRWLGFVVLALPILTNQSPEEAILARLEELGSSIFCLLLL